MPEPSKYSRSNYGGRKGAHGRKRSSSSLKKFLYAILAIVLFAAVAGTAYAAWYMHKIDKAISAPSSDRAALREVTENVDLDKPFYMLVMGSDSREGSGTSWNPANQGDNERSDVMILLRVDAENHQLTMVSIPRDTPYTYPDGTVGKINETYNIGGAPMTIKAVEEVTGVDIAHYAEVRFSDLEGMVDALGGVTVNVDTQLSYKDALTGERVTIEPGQQTLDGQQAQIFARARHEYAEDQDKHRQQNVRQLAIAMMKSVLDKPLFQIPNVVLKLAEFISTDLKASDIIYLAKMFADGDMTLYSCTGPSIGDVNEDAGGIWLCFENPEGWKRLMSVVDSGEDPSGIDVDSTAIIPGSSEEDGNQGDYQTDDEYIHQNDDSYYFTDEYGGYYDYTYDYSDMDYSAQDGYDSMNELNSESTTSGASAG